MNGAKKRRTSSPTAKIIHNFEGAIVLGLVENVVADGLSKFSPPQAIQYIPMLQNYREDKGLLQRSILRLI